MILKSIKLENFRRFKNATIEFSIDRERNVTLIQANNTTGKTTIANAFTWCLHGKTDASDRDDQLLCWEVQNAMGARDTRKVAVTVTMLHGGIEYVFRRTKAYKKFSEAQESEFTITRVSVSDGAKTGRVRSDELRRVRDMIIPEQLLDYIFLKAEQINSMQESIRNNRTRRDLSDAIRILLGWEVVENLIKHLSREANKNTAKNVFESELSRSAVDDNRLLDDLGRVRQELERQRRAYQELGEQGTKMQERITELRGYISDHQAGRELQNQLDGLKKSEQDLLRRQESLKKQILRRFSDDLLSYLYPSVIPPALTLLDETGVHDALVPGLTGTTIEHLLSSGTCICGTELRPGSACYEQLRTLIPRVAPAALGPAVAEFRGKAEARIDPGAYRHLHEDYAQLHDELLDLEMQTDENRDQIDDIEAQVGSITDVAAHEKELRRLEGELHELHNKIVPEKYHDICELEKQEQEAEARLRDAAANNDHNRLLKLCLKYVDYISDYVSRLLTQREQEIRERLQIHMNEMFGRVFKKDYRIVIDGSYELSVSDAHDRRVHTSGSENVFVILAFIASVLQVARDNAARHQQGQTELLLAADPYPLVLDAPLSVFDTPNTHEVCRILPGLTEQIIILSKDTEGDIIRREMADRIGSLYTFTADFAGGRDLCTTTVTRESLDGPD